MPVGAPSWNIFHMACIGQTRLNSLCLQNVIEWNPIYACGFHRHGSDPTGLQPLRHRLQILRERLEYSHRRLVTIRRHGYIDLPRSNVNAASIGPPALGSRHGRSAMHIPFCFFPRPVGPLLFRVRAFPCFSLLTTATLLPLASGSGQIAQQEKHSLDWNQPASGCKHCMAHETWDHAPDRA